MGYVMILSMFRLLLKPLAYLPLRVIHACGAMLGFVYFHLSGRVRLLVNRNLEQSGLMADEASRKKIASIHAVESGKSILETLALWQKTSPQLLATVRTVHNWSLVKDALGLGKGIIFLTPHLGCFEITSIYYGSKHPITVLYRTPKLKFLNKLIEQGRQRSGVTLAEANASGVRKLMQALKRGEAIGILPDQIPAEGEGEWAPFFGKPAYTMTLASKLAEKTGATIIMAFGERLAHGAGYDIHLTKVDSIATPSLLNQAIERQIAQCPSQYLWQYDRYKVRRHSLKKSGNPNTKPDTKNE
jgi:Kdo2-lipid IVA lauroyltransferase/acyltransferase